ncbi:MAG: transcription antitermination factor NusB [Candidatus Omnitrophica bacterium]|nr:transcription antitermination factor NusB [Candidatus Omnitrophota bacterium]
MRKRTMAREIALKILYAMEMTKEAAEESIENYWEHAGEKDEPVVDFTSALVVGVSKNMDKIDGILSESADNWKLARMAVIDRNILRIACFELLFLPDVPPKVAINEAIDMAKKYGDKDSGKFVNGILDRIKRSKDA